MNARSRNISIPALAALSVLLAAHAGFAGDGRIPVYAPDPAATFTISAPGSYYLTEDLTHNGIVVFVNASNVTLDLAGHTITSTSTTAAAVYVPNVSGFRITGGKIAGGAYGVRFVKSAGTTAATVHVDHLTIGGQVIYGVSIEGGGSTLPIIPVVEHNLVAGTGSTGYYLLWIQDGRVENNVARGAGGSGNGIHLFNAFRCSVNHNIADGNAADGITLTMGTTSDTNHSVSYNIASNNGSDGITMGGHGNMLVYNTASNNAVDGIVLSADHNTVQHNTVSGNSRGIYLNTLAEYNSIDWNTAAGNSDCGIVILSGNDNVVSYNRTPNSGNTSPCINGRDIQTGNPISGNLP